MKINSEILSIPPYISTSWGNISSITQQDGDVILILNDSSKVVIPNLSSNIIESIFDTHCNFLENKKTSIKPKTSISFGLPSMLSENNNLDSLSTALQHDPSQKNAEDIPKEILSKIANLSKIFAEDTNMEAPKPHPDCNCIHCQIAKALQLGLGINPEDLDDEVSDEDLKFKSWEIEEQANKLYLVSNPLDNNEYYNVFLGEPIGCTCGKKNCEHIKAVLSS